MNAETSAQDYRPSPELRAAKKACPELCTAACEAVTSLGRLLETLDRRTFDIEARHARYRGAEDTMKRCLAQAIENMPQSVRLEMWLTIGSAAQLAPAINELIDAAELGDLVDKLRPGRDGH